MNKIRLSEKLIDSLRNVEKVFVLSFLAILVFAIYSHTLEFPFHFDDAINIVENLNIRLTRFTLSGIKKASIESLIPNRPVANISFALNYYFHQYHLTGYHIVNILIHIINSILLYFFVKTTLNLQSLPPKYANYQWVPFLAVLIWAVHPLHIQSVTYIVQRMNSLSAMFYLASMLFYVKARLIEGKRVKWLLLGSSALAGLLAIGSKENAAMLPVFIFLYEWYFFQSLDCSWLKQHRFRIAGVLLALALFTFLFLHTEASQMVLSLYKYQHFTLKERVLTEFRVVIYYISLLIFPHPSRLNLDYDFPLSHSLVDPITTLLSILVIAGLIVLAIYMAKMDPVLSFCILWFLGNLVIESSVIGLDLIYEHRTYLPSMLISVVGVRYVYRYIKPTWLRIGLITIGVVVFSVWTYERNNVWSDEVTLWKDCVTKSPNKARPHNDLGHSLLNKDRIMEATFHFKEALRINPNYVNAHNNMGIVLLRQGRHREAIHHLTKALRIIPDFAKAHYNLGCAFMFLGKLERAIYHYTEALRIRPNYLEVHNNLGVVLKQQKRFEEAVFHFKAALRIIPNHREIYRNLQDCIVQMDKSPSNLNTEVTP